MISTYVDAIVMRHPQKARHVWRRVFGRVPVLQCGRRFEPASVQTLMLDLFSIEETQGRLDNLHTRDGRRSKYGRTVHSLTQALAKFSGNRFLFYRAGRAGDAIVHSGLCWMKRDGFEPAWFYRRGHGRRRHPLYDSRTERASRPSGTPM